MYETYSEKFWREMWEKPFASFSKEYNVVDTNRYDIINGEPVERKDYKKKILEAELENLNAYVGVYEKALLEKAKRKEEIEQELKELS